MSNVVNDLTWADHLQDVDFDLSGSDLGETTYDEVCRNEGVTW